MPAPAHAANPPVEKVGRYELIRKLAEGELTDLWLARISGAAGFERYVVVKQIRADRTRDRAFVESFMTEARVAGALHHHNIVQVQDIGEERGHYYLAMEYVHGESLRQVMARLHERKEQMPLQHVLAIVGAVASALHYAHELRGPDKLPAGIVHRAVTPGNIIVGYDGNVKVLDFGIIKAALRSADKSLIASKVPYMAPEECTGQIVDRRADVFALGIVLHEAVTGRRLFKGDTDFLTMSAIAHGIVPRASHYRKDLPPPLEAVITKALSRIPAERYQTADDLRLALEPIATRLTTGMTTSGLAAYMKQLFIGRSEPWHADSGELGKAPRDFDGKANGLAVPPADAIEAFALPTGTAKDAPLTQARSRAITDNPTSKIEVAQPRAVLRAILPLKPPPKPVGEFTEVDVKLPTAEEPPAAAPVEAAREPTAIVAPLPIEGTIRSAHKLGRHKRLLWLAGSTVVAVAAVIIFLAKTATPSPPTTSSAAVAQHSDEPEHAKPAPPKEPAPQQEPAAIPWEKRTWANTEAAKAGTPPPDPAPEPKAEAKAEPAPAPAPEPKAEPAPPPPEPKAEPAPEPKAEPAPEPKVEPAPAPPPEPKAKAKTEPKAEPAHVAEPAPKAKPVHHKPVAKPAVKATAKQPPKPKDWDPDSLFYEKKP